MAEPDTNPLISSPVETVEDSYVKAYESFTPFEIDDEDIYEQVRAANTPQEASKNMAQNIVGCFSPNKVVFVFKISNVIGSNIFS